VLKRGHFGQFFGPEFWDFGGFWELDLMKFISFLGLNCIIQNLYGGLLVIFGDL